MTLDIAAEGRLHPTLVPGFGDGAVNKAQAMIRGHLQPLVANRDAFDDRHPFEVSGALPQIAGVNFERRGARRGQVLVEGPFEVGFDGLPGILGNDQCAQNEHRLLGVGKIRPGVSGLIKIDQMHAELALEACGFMLP